MPNIWKTQDVVLIIGNSQITGKDTVCQNMDISFDNDCPLPELGPFPETGNVIVRPVRDVIIKLTLVCRSEQFTYEFWETDYKPKISRKQVKDCSISELLFAVRKKIRNRRFWS